MYGILDKRITKLLYAFLQTELKMEDKHRDTVEKYLETLDEFAEKFTFLLVSNKRKDGRSTLTYHKSIEDVYTLLRGYNEQDERAVFVMPNATDFMGTKDSNISHIRCFYADIDGTIENPASFGPMPLDPTMIISTGKGEHAYWILKDFIPVDKDSDTLFTTMQKNIIKKLKSDESITRINRLMRVPGFFHSKEGSTPRLVTIKSISGEYYTLADMQEAFKSEIVTKKVSRFVPAIQPPNNVRGALHPDVAAFLKQPWKYDGTDNRQVCIAAANIKKNAYTFQECLQLFEGKGEGLNPDLITSIKSAYDSSKLPVAPFIENEEDSLKQLIQESVIYKNVGINGKGVYLIDIKQGAIVNLTENIARAVKGKEYKLSEKLCFLKYKPYLSSSTFMENTYLHLNTYEPPKWKSDLHFKGVPIEPCEMPIEYDTFMRHLSPDDASRNYILDYLAASLRTKITTTLVFGGTVRGIGKSTFANIMAALHGEKNSEVCKQHILKKEFNAQVVNKTFLNFDEVRITTDEELESIKAYTNARIAAEGKGVESATVDFYASILITNNTAGCLSGVNAKDDRQFSVPILTTKELNSDYFKNSKCGITSVEQLWKDPSLIDRFARYLYHRDLSNFDKNKNFKSAQYDELIRSSVFEWHNFLLEDFRVAHMNTAVRHQSVKDTLKTREGIKIGRVKMKELCSIYPDKIALKYLDSILYVVFPARDESIKSFQTRVENFTTTDDQGFKILAEANPLTDSLRRN